MKDNRNRYNEEIEKYQSMDQFQVGIAVFDPDTTETQFYDNVRSVCEMMNNNISISVGVTGRALEKNLMRRSWKLTGGCRTEKCISSTAAGCTTGTATINV